MPKRKKSSAGRRKGGKTRPSLWKGPKKKKNS